MWRGVGDDDDEQDLLDGGRASPQLDDEHDSAMFLQLRGERQPKAAPPPPGQPTVPPEAGEAGEGDEGDEGGEDGPRFFQLQAERRPGTGQAEEGDGEEAAVALASRELHDGERGASAELSADTARYRQLPSAQRAGEPEPPHAEPELPVTSPEPELPAPTMQSALEPALEPLVQPPPPPLPTTTTRREASAPPSKPLPPPEPELSAPPRRVTPKLAPTTLTCTIGKGKRPHRVSCTVIGNRQQWGAISNRQ